MSGIGIAIRIAALIFSLCSVALSASPKYLHIYGEYDSRLKSNTRATWLYDQAVENNNTDAAFDLALFYRRTLKDYPKAIEWFNKAYEQSNYKDGGAAYSLGLVYERELKDYPKAIEWYEIAHTLKDDRAAFAVGLMYDDYIKDYPKAIEWYTIAYNKGFIDAAYSLGLLYKQKLQDYPKAIEWYTIAHNKGDKGAAYALGILYDDILKDYPKAIEWYEIASKKYNGATARMGAIYLEGKGVKQDIIKARSLFEKTINETRPNSEAYQAAKKALADLDANQSK
ncbi:MAG: tetratricopeptide repeat protein [Helicobacteraceae bacterium]|jgi:TPR repeat protein|nr:tetratricopeptide repeat protein [Helicobacteraceae bacterium]